MKTILLSIMTAIILTGCSTYRITSSWNSGNVSPKTYEKILVVGIIGEPDRTIREKMEDHMVGDLNDLGYDAVSASREYGPKAFENMNEAEVLHNLKEKGIQAVVTIVLLDKEREKYYEPGRVVYSPYAIYQDRFWRYYSTMHDRVYGAGYYTNTNRYFWESNFYDLFEWNLIYSVQSQSFDPGSTSALAHEYGKTIVRDMIKNKVLADQKSRPKPF